MALVFILSGITYYFLISYIFIHELDESLNGYRHRLHAYVKEKDAIPLFQPIDDVVIFYQPVTQKAKTHYASTIRLDDEDKKKKSFREIVFTEKVNGSLYKFNVAKPIEGTKLAIKSIFAITFIILLVVIFSSVLLNRIILKKLWRPFYNTVKELGNFKLSKGHVPDFPTSAIDEFSILNNSLTQVVHAASNDYRILKEFTENAAHELQTPLAIIRSKLDIVIQEEGLSENQSLALNTAYQGVHRLTKLNQSLLLLAKIENNQFKSVDMIDLAACLLEKGNQFEEFLEGQGITLLMDINETTITANAALIDILLNNMLGNAVRHNIKGGEIRVLLQPGILKITNTATAAALDDVKLFTRFYKEASHSQSNGLGLSIIKQICDAQGFGIGYSYEKGYHTFMVTWT